MGMIKVLITIFLLSWLTNCSMYEKYILQNDKSIEVEKIDFSPRPEDYKDQLVFLSKDLINNLKHECWPMNKKMTEYLKSLYFKIAKNNRSVFEEVTPNPKFYVINTLRPVSISLPEGHFFISLGMLQKYIKNELLLISMLSFEMLKSFRYIYLKKIIIPTGYMSLEKIMGQVKVPFKIRVELNKWAYLVMDRAGFDATVYLNWLQIQNRNALDFSYQLKDTQSISREEQMFKSYLAKRNKGEKYTTIDSNSSEDFYKFINKIKRLRPSVVKF